MLKWILGAVAALVLILGGTCWYSYKQFTKGGDTAQVTIASSPERVWRYLTIPDSIQAWQDSAVTVTASGDSALAVGDTIRLAGAVRRGNRESTRTLIWVVTRMVEPTVIAWAARDDSTGMALLQRTDSLAAIGDSVLVTSRFVAPLTDSLRQADSAGPLAERFLTGASKLATAAMRTMAERELGRLKARLEGP
jgi:uncharacterized protein YndB with AHSA1/START domain